MQNTILALGGSGEALGGGIWNGTIPDSQDLTPQLSLAGALIPGNAISADPGIQINGGGLFTTQPVAAHGTRIRGNSPDQCIGC